MYKIQVLADNSGVWAGNALTFHDVAAAVAYARDLTSRWMLVRDWRVVTVAGEDVITSMDDAR